MIDVVFEVVKQLEIMNKNIEKNNEIIGGILERLYEFDDRE